MAVITEILTMVQQILAYFQEAEAAGVLEIVKSSIEAILAYIPMPL